jgi:hypothetical protein
MLQHCWFMHYGTSRNVAGRIADEIIDSFFSLPNPSSRIIVLAFSQPLTEIITAQH